MQNKPNKVIVHHSAFVQAAEQKDQINEWHKDRGFLQSENGLYIGYHYLIAHDGTITKTKELTEEGCHTIGQNTQSVGICLEGNFDEELPTAAQEDALGRLLLDTCDAFDIPYTQIFPHRKFANKDCYGTKLSDEYATILCLKTKVAALEADQHLLPTVEDGSAGSLAACLS